MLEQKRYKDSETSFLNSLKISPNNADTYTYLGRLYSEQKLFEQAEICYKNAITLQPSNERYLNNLGALYLNLKRYDVADHFYSNILKSEPQLADTFNNLALLMLNKKNYSAAIGYCNKALDINSTLASAYNNLGLIFLEQKLFLEAENAFHEALLNKPLYADANYNLGNLYQQQKRYDKAESFYQNALEFQPDFIDARTNLAIMLLMLGRFKEGWVGYESRCHPDKHDRKTIPPAFKVPHWHGEPLIDKSMLIWAEQGIGDEVMFASCFNELKNHQGKITIACDHRLTKLFAQSFPFLVFIETDPSNHYLSLVDSLDYHCAIGSLPHFFRNDKKDFESTSSYLKVNQDLLSKWKQRYSQLKYSINIGISWRGGKDSHHQQLRSIELSKWLPILKHEANFINLQYGDHQSEINKFTDQTGIQIFDWDDANPLTDLDNFSAQVKALDLVISIDNATVHFSGALGVKTFALLPYQQEWRWMNKGDDSLWYPNTMKLFRQEEERDWSTVILDTTKALNKRVSLLES